MIGSSIYNGLERADNNGTMSTIKIVTGNSHPKLAALISQRLNIELVKCKVGKFANQETRY